MTLRQDFFESSKLVKIWNKKVQFHNITICGVMWHDLSWKIVDGNDDFDDISDYNYTPIAQFHTQQGLWQYIKENNLIN